MDKNLLRDAQLKIADARSCVQAVLDDGTDLNDDKEALMEEILTTLEELDSSIETLMAENNSTATE